MTSPLSLFPSLDTVALERLALSGAIVAAVLGGRAVVERTWTCRGERAARHRRRFALRTGANALLALALVALWISQLQTVLLSLTAVMVAFVIAAKELIMCAAGAVLRVGGQLFRIGDRIEVRGLHGEVIDHGLFSTTLQELPPVGAGHRGTGRTFVLPNSVFLTDAVRVEATPRRYAPHRFALTLERPVPVGAALDALLSIARDAVAEDRERAERFHRMSAAHSGCDEEGPEPSVRVRTSDIGKLVFEVGVYCLIEDVERVERAIARAWLDRFAGPEAAEAPREADGAPRDLAWAGAKRRAAAA